VFIDAIGDISDQIFDPHGDLICVSANVGGRAWTGPLNAQKCGSWTATRNRAGSLAKPRRQGPRYRVRHRHSPAGPRFTLARHV
jgi:hypothetical protein